MTGYCRVSTSTQMTEIRSQVKLVEEYMQALDYISEIISEVGGELNYQRKGLLNLLKIINQ
ncbi:recombinase family protein [Ruoffia halotolerans]|nr:recombinase family protein [Ruoffia halotolerans]